jgi:hypothetical protein
VIAALALVLAAAQGPAAPQARDSFPHPVHRRLFTQCVNCHAGILTGDSATARPPVSLCATCHDGQDQRTVNWAPRPARPSNLRYDHPAHIAAVQRRDGETLSCMRCHSPTDSAQTLMEVARARPARCITCHAHQAERHLAANADCRTCHRPLAEARGLATERIADFPKPASHDSTWVYRHNDAARSSASCAVCHARDYCASCHVNAARVAAIQALGPDPRVAEIARTRPVRYVRPPSHLEADFSSRHAPATPADGERCAACHARESCMACHGQQIGGNRAIAQIPARGREASGVSAAALRPAGHVPGFATDHRAAAAGGDPSCMQCHTQRFCSTCHDASTRPPFHPLDFVARHQAATYTPDNECAACHQVQTFCRDCHLSTGRAAPRAQFGSYHTAQPAWRLGHAAAARRSIETCATCHVQVFCLQCHSAKGGQGVSPHGPGFNAGMADRNASMCRYCHLTVPQH